MTTWNLQTPKKSDTVGIQISKKRNKKSICSVRDQLQCKPQAYNHFRGIVYLILNVTPTSRELPQKRRNISNVCLDSLFLS